MYSKTEHQFFLGMLGMIVGVALYWAYNYNPKNNIKDSWIGKRDAHDIQW